MSCLPDALRSFLNIFMACSHDFLIYNGAEQSRLTPHQMLFTLQKRIVLMPLAISSLIIRVASTIELCRPSEASISSIGGGFHTRKSFDPLGAPSFVITCMFLTVHQSGQRGSEIHWRIPYVDTKYALHMTQRIRYRSATRNEAYSTVFSKPNISNMSYTGLEWCALLPTAAQTRRSLRIMRDTWLHSEESLLTGSSNVVLAPTSRKLRNSSEARLLQQASGSWRNFHWSLVAYFLNVVEDTYVLHLSSLGKTDACSMSCMRPMSFLHPKKVRALLTKFVNITDAVSRIPTVRIRLYAYSQPYL